MVPIESVPSAGGCYATWPGYSRGWFGCSFGSEPKGCDGSATHRGESRCFCATARGAARSAAGCDSETGVDRETHSRRQLDWCGGNHWGNLVRGRATTRSGVHDVSGCVCDGSCRRSGGRRDCGCSRVRRARSSPALAVRSRQLIGLVSRSGRVRNGKT